jgi:RimJ/RimL family protein N-acetyltransferase
MLVRAIVDDIPQIQAVAAKSWQATYKDIFPADFILNFIKRAYTTDGLRQSIERDSFHVKKVEGQLVGFCHGGVRSHGAELFRIYLLPGEWGKGIGGELLQAMESDFAEQSVTDYHCYVHSQNEVGIAFYKKQGFTHQPEHDKDSEWYMHKRIAE